MSRRFFLDLAASGRRVPIATHLVLHEQADPDAILVNGRRLASVMSETARRFDSPLALPIMDLTLEKELMLSLLGLGGDERAKYHFEGRPSPEAVALLSKRIDVASLPRIAANLEALSIIARSGELMPVGMSIGPFSLLSKLVSDPITGIYMAGAGTRADDDESVAQLVELLALAERVIADSCEAQVAAGAKAIFVCEPAANTVYFSPKQMREGSSVFEDFVIAPNLRLKKVLDSVGADLVFHDCGELSPEMIRAFARLDPVMMSFGSPVKLWEAAELLPKDIVIYGNLPTKKFYSDIDIPLDRVGAMADDIAQRMRDTGHPYVIGSECDVLSMPGYEKAIMAKVQRFCSCGH